MPVKPIVAILTIYNVVARNRINTCTYITQFVTKSSIDTKIVVRTF